MVNYIYCEYSEKYELLYIRKLHNVFNVTSAVICIQRAPPVAGPRLPKLRRVCHFCGAELPAQRLIKLQIRNRLCIRTRISHQSIMAGFRFEVCRLVKLQPGDCLYCF